MTVMRYTGSSEHGAVGEVFLHRSEIDARVGELAADVSASCRGHDPVVVAALRPDAPLLLDLTRNLSIPCTIENIALAPYREGLSGHARLLKDVDVSLRGRHVVLVVDVVDTGLTLNFVCKTLGLRKPRSLAALTLLDRPHRRLVDVPLRWVGFTAPDYLFAGYGLGLDARWRALRDLHVIHGTDLPDAARKAA
jgi:hypoxanthine phosphoribosyltransferase